jgi:hypothetical protein
MANLASARDHTFGAYAPKAVLHSAATALPLSTRLGHWRPIFAVMHHTPLI